MSALDWLRDRAVRKVVRFGVPAALGKLLSSVAGLVTMALLARHLGPAAFGVVAVIRTVVAVVDQYANFNTWQAIVTYGTEAIAQHRRQDVERVIKLSVCIDLATGITAGLVVIGLAYVIPSAFGWSADESRLCALYGLTLVTRVGGASDGIFRLCDAYRAQAISTSLGALTITASVAIAVATNASFAGCVYALLIGETVGNLLFAGVAFWVARDKGYAAWPTASLVGVRATFPGIARFFVATNLQLTVKRTSTELDMVIVGAMLGKASAGLFRVVKQLSSIPARIFLPFEQVVFTELARAVATRDLAAFRKLLYRFSALVAVGALALWLVAVVTAVPLITAIAGEAYVDAAPAFRVHLLAVIVLVVTTAAQRAIVALGRPGTLLGFELVGLALLAVGLLIAASRFGLVGVSAAVALHRILQLVIAFGFVAKKLRDDQSGER
jgi:O-antigen/teichoic acid export membrane protein